MPRRRKKRGVPLYCKGCSNALDPNGHVYKIHRGPHSGIYCRACFFTRAFKCRQCSNVYLLDCRGVSSNSLCVGCERSNHSDLNIRNVGWDKAYELVGTTFETVKSDRRFGVEIETAQCKYVDRIQGKTPFGAKHDSTITGKEFDSPILSGDEGLAAVCDFCDIAKRRGWTVDKYCGTHIHLDMSSEKDYNLRAIATGYFFTYRSWAKLVDPLRVCNDFCGPPDYSAHYLSTASPFLNIANSTNRYTFINIAAYCRHRTFELRGLEGTLDKNLLANWLISHLTFADFCAKLTIEQVTELFSGTEVACWHNLKKHVLGDTARYLGRLRAKQAKSKHHD